MLGTHVPLWEGSIALGETHSLLGRLYPSGRDMPLGETHAPLGWLYPSGRWEGSILWKEKG